MNTIKKKYMTATEYKKSYLKKLGRRNSSFSDKRYFTSDDSRVNLCLVAININKALKETDRYDGFFERQEVIIYSTSFIKEPEKTFDRDLLKKNLTLYIENKEIKSPDNWISYLRSLERNWRSYPEVINLKLIHNILYFMGGQFYVNGDDEIYDLIKQALFKTLRNSLLTVASILIASPSYYLTFDSFVFAKDMHILMDIYGIPWFQLFKSNMETYIGINKEIVNEIGVSYMHEKGYKVHVLFDKGLSMCKDYVSNYEFSKIKEALTFMKYKVHNDCFNKKIFVSPILKSYILKKYHMEEVSNE